MDVYGVEEADILRDPQGLIKVIALADGITTSDVTQLDQVKKIRSVDINHVPAPTEKGCIGERWL